MPNFADVMEFERELAQNYVGKDIGWHSGSSAIDHRKSRQLVFVANLCQCDLRRPRIAGGAFAVVGSGTVSPWSDLIPRGSVAADSEVGQAGCRTSARGE